MKTHPDITVTQTIPNTYYITTNTFTHLNPLNSPFSLNILHSFILHTFIHTTYILHITYYISITHFLHGTRVIRLGGGRRRRGRDDCNSYCQEDIPKTMVLGHHETWFGRVGE